MRPCLDCLLCWTVLEQFDDGAGRFELSYLAPEGRVLLNDPQAIGLHDLLNAAK